MAVGPGGTIRFSISQPAKRSHLSLHMQSVECLLGAIASLETFSGTPGTCSAALQLPCLQVVRFHVHSVTLLR